MQAIAKAGFAPIDLRLGFLSRLVSFAAAFMAAGARQPARAQMRGVGRHEAATVDSPLHREILCEAGVVWLTFDGEAKDVILSAGQSHRCANRSRLVIFGVTAAEVRIS